MTLVLAPCPGEVVGLAGVPDPVFAEALVGPGTAVEPRAEEQVAVAPISGSIMKLHPHAFVIVGPDGRGVLTHLGIDTVNLKGEGFTLLANEGDQVEAGAPIVRWNPADIAARGLASVCPVIALDAAPEAIHALVTSGPIEAGAPLFDWQS